MGTIRDRVYRTYQEVEVEIDFDDILNELSEDEIKELYEDAFGLERDLWFVLYEKRRKMSDAEFLSHVDKVIMDMTGRIL